MAKKRDFSPAQPLVARLWSRTKPFHGPFLSVLGMGLFITLNTVLQIIGMISMLIGGFMIGGYFRDRRRKQEGQKAIQRKLEKKEARKRARAERLAGTDESTGADDSDNSEE